MRVKTTRVLHVAAAAFFFAAGFFLMPAYGAQVTVASINPHEAAYEQASTILVATVDRFDDQGVWIRVDRSMRGGVAAGTIINLQDTSRYPFLSEAGANLVVFLEKIDSDRGALVFAPTSGGLIWKDTKTLTMIASAHAAPVKELRSNEPRTQLAAAYYLTVGGAVSGTELSDEQRALAADAAIWGLRHRSAEVAQSAVLVLESMGFEVGEYHPAAKLELRRQLADRIATSLE